MREFSKLLQYKYKGINDYWEQANRALDNGALEGDYVRMSKEEKETVIKEFIFLKACCIEKFDADDLVILYEQLNTPGSRHDRIAKAFASANLNNAFIRGDELNSDYLKDILLTSVKNGLPRGTDKEIDAYLSSIKGGNEGLRKLREKRRESGRKVPMRRKPSPKIFNDGEIQNHETEHHEELTARNGIVSLDAKFSAFNEKMLSEINKLISDSEQREKNKDNISGSYTDLVNAAKDYKKALFGNESPSRLYSLLNELETKASLYTAGHKGIMKGNGPKGRMRYNASVKIKDLLDTDYKAFMESYESGLGHSVAVDDKKGYYDIIKNELSKSDPVYAKAQAMRTANKNYAKASNDLKKRCLREVRNEHGNVYKVADESFLAEQRKKITELAACAIVLEANKEKAEEYIRATDKNSFNNSLALADQTFSGSVMDTLVSDLMSRDAFKNMINENTKTMADITKMAGNIKKGNFGYCYREYNKAVEKENAQLKKEKEKKKEKERVREMEKPDKLKLPGLGI